jgi:protocatechuate 3,4-dioxygenase, alpha subunit
MTPTPSQTVGPFFGVGLPPVDGAEGIRIDGHVLDGAGQPVDGVLLEAWHEDQFARCRTDSRGAFHLMARPAPFLNITVFARGLLRHVNTRMYFPGSAEDTVLSLVDPSRRHTLIAKADGEVLRFDIRLQGDGETVFFAGS